MCRGGLGGSFGRGLVGNGGLWWPETELEVAGLMVLSRGCHLCFLAGEDDRTGGVEWMMMVVLWKAMGDLRWH